MLSRGTTEFIPHSTKQASAIGCVARILLLGTGTQWGKTIVGGLRMRRAIHQHRSKEDAFIIAAPNYKTLHQSTLPAFLKLMHGLGRYSNRHEVFEISGGGVVYCRTETDPDSIVGITNVRRIWGDEAGKYRLYFWENIQARADFYGCPIDLTTSPYALNWIYGLIKQIKAHNRPDIELIQAASWESPYHSLHDPEKLRQKRATMDERRFNMLYGGRWDKMAGLVYDCWDEDQNICEPFSLPAGTRFVAGVDWGYSPDPFVITVRAIAPDGMHYQVAEFYKTGLTPSDMVRVAGEKKRVWSVEHFYCDPSQPGLIEEFNRAGLSAIAADNDLPRGIGAHYELIKTRRFKIWRGTSPFSRDELETYHYPESEDLRPDQHAKEPRPVDQSNHALDSARYTSIMTYRTRLARSPRIPTEWTQTQETREQRTRRLMRFQRGSRQTEGWS